MSPAESSSASSPRIPPRTVGHYRLRASLLFDGLLDDCGDACPTTLSGRSSVTTLPAAITQPLPMVTPCSTDSFAPNQQLSPTTMGRAFSRPKLRSFAFQGVRSGVEAAKRPDKHVATKGDRAAVHKVAAMVYKTALTEGRLAPVVKVGRRKDRQPPGKIGIGKDFKASSCASLLRFCHIKVIAERLRLRALRRSSSSKLASCHSPRSIFSFSVIAPPQTTCSLDAAILPADRPRF